MRLALTSIPKHRHHAPPQTLNPRIRRRHNSHPLALAAAIGWLIGWLGARALTRSRERGWIGRRWSQIAVLGLVLLAFASADAVEGSGFIATWVAGVAFGRSVRGAMGDVSLLAEDLGALLAEVSFLGFGAVLLGPILGDLSWRALVYATLSLTAIRMLPVAVSLVGAGLAPVFQWIIVPAAAMAWVAFRRDAAAMRSVSTG